MKTHNDAYNHVFDGLPEDVKALLNLVFGDGEYMYATNHAGDYNDIVNDLRYFFIQRIPTTKSPSRAQNRARFISWVRNGMPEGHGVYENPWTQED